MARAVNKQADRERSAKRRRDLDDLANALLVRHLQASWPEPRESMPSWFGDAPPRGYRERLRTVAVVGAGASYPMESIADDLATELEQELDRDGHDREVELDRLENVYALDRHNFETRLTAICRTPEAERKVQERISERYRHRHPSLLTYELLAHLLHHRFLDAIISFNFDELLDQAIDDELGPNEYWRVVTERDCDPGTPAPAPLYVKMHGTASEPDSLRFTRERYYWTPKSIIELVEKEFEVEHLVVMNVGCRMSSFDFQYLLRKPDQLRIFHLDPNRLTPTVTKEIKNQRTKERERQKVPRPEIYNKPEVADFSSPKKVKNTDFLPQLLTEVVDSLWKRCRATDAGPTVWRSTLRHRAVVEILKSSQIDTDDQYASYLRRRTILELAFAAARNRGVLSIATMVDDRCGRYYDLYQRKAGEDYDGWQKLCEAGGLEESRRWPDTYEVLPQLRKDPVSDGDADNIHLLRPADPAKLAEHVMKSMNVADDVAGMTGLLTETLEFLQAETEIEVHARDDRVCSKSFIEPVILRTFTALEGWTQEMIESTGDYNELWAVAESGKWLSNPRVIDSIKAKLGSAPLASGRKPIRLLAAFELDLPELDGLTEPSLLPWGRHNRHMTIVCKDEEPRAAVYFVRRLRTPTVTPVYLRHQKDLHRIAEAFEKLWLEAEEYGSAQQRAASPEPKRGRR